MRPPAPLPLPLPLAPLHTTVDIHRPPLTLTSYGFFPPVRTYFEKEAPIVLHLDSTNTTVVDVHIEGEEDTDATGSSGGSSGGGS